MRNSVVAALQGHRDVAEGGAVEALVGGPVVAEVDLQSVLIAGGQSQRDLVGAASAVDGEGVVGDRCRGGAAEAGAVVANPKVNAAVAAMPSQRAPECMWMVMSTPWCSSGRRCAGAVDGYYEIGCGLVHRHKPTASCRTSVRRAEKPARSMTEPIVGTRRQAQRNSALRSSAPTTSDVTKGATVSITRAGSGHGGGRANDRAEARDEQPSGRPCARSPREQSSQREALTGGVHDERRDTGTEAAMARTAPSSARCVRSRPPSPSLATSAAPTGGGSSGRGTHPQPRRTRAPVAPNPRAAARTASHNGVPDSARSRHTSGTRSPSTIASSTRETPTDDITGRGADHLEISTPPNVDAATSAAPTSTPSAGIAALAAEVLEVLPESHPNFSHIADAEARAQLTLGLTDRAFNRYQMLVSHLEQLVAVEPDHTGHQSDLASSYERSG